MVRSQKIMVGYIIVLVIGVVLIMLPTVSDLNHIILDKQFKFLIKIYRPELARDIVIVGIDEDATRRYREPLALWHPHLGRMLKALALAMPKAVVIDLILPDKSYEFIKPGIDRQLLSGLLTLNKIVPVIIARTVDENGRYRPLFPPITSLLGEKNIGLALVRSDSDHIVRKLTPVIQSENTSSPTLVGALATSLGLQAEEGLINYTLNSGFQYIPMSHLADWSLSGDITSLKRVFSNKVVFVGSVMPFVDRHYVPLPIAAWEAGNYRVPGVLVHAQSAITVMQDAAIIPVDKFWALIFTFFITLIWWLGKKYYLIIIIFGITVLFLPALSTYLLYQGLWLPIGGLLALLFITVFLRLSLEGVFGWQDKEKLSASFSRYVSPQVMDEIIAGKIKPGIGGKRCMVCVLFSDIRDFTSRCEGQEPEATIKILNRYFNVMVEAIHSHGGTIDKFIGDGLMAFFGAPNSQDRITENAFAAAQDMLDRLKTLNLLLEDEGIVPIDIGIGLHLGEAIIGHVGSNARHEYTAIGDTVNLASRIEELTKQFGFPIVCSLAVKKQLDVPFVPLGEVSVKGHTPIHAYGWMPN